MTGSSGSKVAVIAGASPGFGAALSRRLLAADYKVAALGRTRALAALADDLPGVHLEPADLAEPAEVDRAFSAVESRFGRTTTLIYNAARLELSSFLDVSLDSFDDCFRSNCRGAFVVLQRCIPGMLEAGDGTIVATGATASLRGGKATAAFASSKFALRGLIQSVAREFSPRGIHVVHVVLDGLIWGERTRSRFPAAEEGSCMSPDDLARVYWGLIEQPRSAWTHEIDLRPYVERF